MIKKVIQKSLIRKFSILNSLNFSKSNLINRSTRTKSQKNKHQKGYAIHLLCGMLTSIALINEKIKCEQDNKSEYQVKSKQIDIFQLNKIQLVFLLSNVKEDSILIVFDKYFKNQKNNQFAKKLQKVYSQAKQLNISKIYLVDSNDVKHLQIFERWIKNEQRQPTSSQNLTIGQQNQRKKLQYYFLTPQFQSNPFKVDEQNQIIQNINQVRTFSIKVNPLNIKEQIFLPYQTIFNRTVVVKQCPQFTSNQKSNQCIQSFRKKVVTLIQQKMLKNKTQEYRFFALTPTSKKDSSPLSNFHSQLKNHLKETKLEGNILQQNLLYGQKEENTFVLRNDIIGKQVKSFKHFKKENYSTMKKLTGYDKFLFFIKPRIFIISKANPSIDLYWYVTCLHKNQHPSLSINNTDKFILGHKYPTTNGLSYPLNHDLEFLKILYKNHPELNYVIVNTQVVSELMRHLQIKNKYVIFNLTSQIIYPKLFLPYYDYNLSPQQNYQQKYRSLIQNYLLEPKVYDKVLIDKEKKIDISYLNRLIQKLNKGGNKQNSFILRVCNLKCQEDITDQKLQKFFHKLIHSKKNKINKWESQTIQKQNYNQYSKHQKNWKNQAYSNTYWIDSYFNNVGLKEGEYFFSNGKFQSL